MKTVTISECKSNGKIWESRHKTENDELAIEKAIKKQFGENAGFHRDTGLADIGMYGQIAVPIGKQPGQSSTITGRVRIDVE